MAQSSFLRRFVLRSIEEKGRIGGAPKVNFLEKKISIEGEDLYVEQGWLQWWSFTNGFYLTLPPNAYGVVVFPDGTSHNMAGGLHEAPAGLYKLQYVDNHERFDFSAPVSEMTTDGEKLTLRILLRYRVIDPVLALSIARPVETLIEHIETDVAQYIRTHDHGDIADSSDKNEYNKLFSFVSERHNRRSSLSKAFAVTGIELKDFTGDKDYVEMRRNARIDEKQNKIEQGKAAYQQDLSLLKAQHKADNEKSMAAHKADLEKMEARHETEKQEILRQVRLQEIELDDKRKRWQRQYNKYAKALEAVSLTYSGGYSTNPNITKTINDLVAALKEEADNEPDPAPEPNPMESESHTAPSITSAGADKVEKLTNTLLNLLNPKK